MAISAQNPAYKPTHSQFLFVVTAFMRLPSNYPMNRVTTN